MNTDPRDSLVPDATGAEFGAPEPLEPDPIEPAPPTARVADEPAPRRRMQRAWGRSAAGLVVSGAAVLAVVAGALAPWPTLAGSAASLEVEPAPSEAVLACEGPVLALGRDVTAATSIGIAAPAAVTAGRASGGEPSAQGLAQPDVAGEEAPSRVVQAPEGRTLEPIAAGSSASVDEEDIAGFAASACRPPQLESWIVGGETSVGEADILLISNPGATSATVQLTVYGATDPVVPPGFEALPIPAGTQRAIPLAGIAGGEAAPVVRVTATGAPVRAALQSSLVRTLDPVGLDRQGAVTADARQRFPGVVVTEAGNEAEGASTALVRVMSRGAASAVITAIPAGETEAAVEPVSVALEPDRPVAVDLGELPEGRYEVTVAGDGPLVSAVWQTTGFGPGTDFAWQTPSPELTAATLVAVPAGPGARLHVSSDEGATVVVTDRSGAARELAVPAGSSGSLPLDDGEVYTVDPGGSPVHAAVGYAGGAALAFIPVWPDPASPAPVTVYP
ncbi:DUF5719 family protein [Microbacterium sp. Marseille-Q6965]|uniref:DUF5719 family protein n=1 Tax=Microbacterium sp. Marseille-Q6965 TaxID=2965072 RepID=UPI0021B7F5D1|nr:DUF5719 family protein [Microbacterium sp. Marseille-Q6965]